MEIPPIVTQEPITHPRQKTRFLVGIVSVLGSFIISSLFISHIILCLLLVLILPGQLFRVLWPKPDAKSERVFLLIGLILTALILMGIITLLTPSPWKIVAFFCSASPALLFVACSYLALERTWCQAGSMSPLPIKEKYPSDETWLAHLCFLNFVGWIVYHGTILPLSAPASMSFFWFILPIIINWLLLLGALAVLKYFPPKEVSAPTQVSQPREPIIEGQHEVYLRGQLYCTATVILLSLCLGSLFSQEKQGQEGLPAIILNLLIAVALIAGFFWSLYHLWFRPTLKTDRLVLGLVILVPCSFTSLFIDALLPSDFSEIGTWIWLFLMVPVHAKIYRHFEIKWVKENVLPPMPDGSPWPSPKAWFTFAFTWLSLSWLGASCGLSGTEGEDLLHNDFFGLILPGLLAVLMCRTLYRKFLGPEVAIFHLESWKS